MAEPSASSPARAAMHVELPDPSPGTGAPSWPLQGCLDSVPDVDLLTGLLVAQVRARRWLDAVELTAGAGQVAGG